MFNLTIDKIQIQAGNFPCKQVASINGDQFVAFVEGIVKSIVDKMAQDIEHEEQQPDKTQEEQGGNPSGEPDGAEQ